MITTLIDLFKHTVAQILPPDWTPTSWKKTKS